MHQKNIPFDKQSNIVIVACKDAGQRNHAHVVPDYIYVTAGVLTT